MARHHGRHVFDLGRVGVQGDDAAPRRMRLEGVAPAAGAEVQQPVARPDPEPLVANGQHGTGSCRPDAR